MKQTRLPLFSMLLLLTSMAFIFMLQENGSFQLYNDNPVAKTRNSPVSNLTLLKHASIDISEPKLKQEIESLLDNGNRSRQRSLSSGKDPKLWVARLHIRSKPERNQVLSRFRRLLMDWSRMRRFYPDVMLDLVNEIANGKYYKSCAIVGNSGILLRKEYGQLIDGHEFVIRLNNARINGYEKNVGSKTNLSFVNSNVLHLCTRMERCFCHPYGDNVPMIMYICQPAHLLDYLVCNASYKSPLMITDPQFDVLCSRIVKYYSLKRFVEFEGKEVSEWPAAHDGEEFHYSSGMQAVMLALGICEKVSLFGFGKSDKAKHHYHTNQKAELSLHDYEAEYDFYHDLMERPEAIPFIPDGFKLPRVMIHR